jgi:hypothetical protein
MLFMLFTPRFINLEITVLKLYPVYNEYPSCPVIEIRTNQCQKKLYQDVLSVAVATAEFPENVVLCFICILSTPI